jgi:hypothetical protein
VLAAGPQHVPDHERFSAQGLCHPVIGLEPGGGGRAAGAVPAAIVSVTWGADRPEGHDRDRFSAFVNVNTVTIMVPGAAAEAWGGALWCRLPDLSRY